MSRRGRLRASLAGLLVAALVPAAAAANGIRAEVDRVEVALGQQIVLRLTIEGSQRARPVLPELEAFDVVSRGQSTQLSFVNGRASSSVTHTYVLLPRSAGSHTIGPATVEIDGTTYRSQPITVNVLAAGEQPAGGSRDLFVTVRVSSTRPWVGQQLIYTWRLYRRVQVADARLEPPSFTGFLVEDLGETREYETTVNGQGYLVSEIRKALFPLEEGELEIPATRLTCQVAVRDERRRRSLFDDFFSSGRTEPRVLRTEPIRLEVRPLPEAPPGFSGLVGSFDLESSLSRRELKVGETVTLDLTISGTGNVQMIPPPRLPELTSFKVYEDKPSARIDRTGAELAGSKTFRRALVPLAPGELALPEVDLVYFDPESGGYREVTAPGRSLRVLPAEGREDLRLTESVTPTAGKVAVRVLADDILPIHRAAEGVGRPAPWLAPGPALAAGLALPPLLTLGLWLADRRRRRLAGDTALRRRRGALRRAKRELAALGDAGLEAGEAAERASRCLREYVGDMLDVEGAALTPAEAESLLSARASDGREAEAVRELLERLDAARYGAATMEKAAIVERVGERLRRLEGSLR